MNPLNDLVFDPTEFHLESNERCEDGDPYVTSLDGFEENIYKKPWHGFDPRMASAGGSVP